MPSPNKTLLQQKEYQRCNRCIVDTSVSGAKFDANGICTYCHLHDKMTKQFPIGEQGQKITDTLVAQIKKEGRDNKYDCAVGISGGRDSMYSLYYMKKLGLNPIAVHFNDGFGNPTAGENMRKGTKILGVDLRTITSDWRESKDLKITCLKASIPNLGMETDIGIATALYGVATKENIKTIVIGQSFRTEGIAPLSWNYLDGKYIKSIHKEFSTTPLRKWTPTDPGFTLGIKELFYYTVVKGIKTIPLLYYHDYVRKDVDQLLEKELGWVNTGAHYFDDLYQAFITYVIRVKFNRDRRLINYSALIRSRQMSRVEGIKRVKEIYSIEDPKIIDLCIKRLGITHDEFDTYMKLPNKYFTDYSTSYNFIKLMKLPIKILSTLNILPGSAYDKYFNCGT